MKALDIKNLKKQYANGFIALKDISLTVEQGDFFALLGPNGAGKSTTIGIITSLINKSSGTVTCFNHDLDTHPELVKECIGLVPQEFNFSVFERVLQILVKQAGFYGIPRALALERSETYLKKLGLWDKRNDRARHLSGGQKRRLMIARALVHEPPLLILDEPTAGVDIELRRAMWQFLLDINTAGTTIILTTHYLEEAEQLCRNIAIIDDGQIIENTSTDKLLATLQKESFILNLANKINFLPSSNEFNIKKINDTTLSIDISQGQRVNDLFDFLSQHNIHVLSMRNKTNRLEELFLRMTGSKTDEN